MLIWICGAAATIVLGLMLFIYLNQDKIVFYPARDLSVLPDQLGIPFDDVYIDVDQGEKIHGWFIRTDSDQAAPRKTVLFCHGNGGNISNRLETVQLIHELGADLFIFDYRGYGRSDGSPTEKGLYADAGAAFQWLTETCRIDPSDIVIFGRSLGGTVAIELAARTDCSGLIVESSFTSAADMGKHIYPFLPIQFLIKYHFNSIEKIEKISCPVFIAHSPTDEMIPYYMGKALYDRAPQPKEFLDLTGGHNETGYFSNPAYRYELKRLLTPGSL